MLLKSPKLVKLLQELLHEFDPFNFIVETDADRDALIITEADISKLCKVKSDESIWILKNFADKGLIWESLSGLNAYELDKKYNNFQGTLTEWFEHWRGYSAFEIWQQHTQSPNGTEDEYIKSITGPAGDGTTIFTLDERKTSNVWVSKKVIWRKVVNIGQLNNGTVKTTAHGIKNIETVVNIFGYAQQNVAGVDGEIIVPIPTAASTGSMLGPQANDVNILISCVGNWTAYSGICIIEYTKTIDPVLTDEEIAALETKSGDPGKSAYDIAKENGFTGTEQEYYEFIKASADKNILIYGSSPPKQYIPIINYQGSDPLSHISDQTKFTHNTASYVREGKHLYVRGQFTCTVAGTGGRLDIFLPENLTIDTLNEQTYTSVVGNVFRLNVTTNQYYVVAISNTNYITFNYQNAAGNNFNIAANSQYSYWFKIPIKEWQGSTFLDEIIETTVGMSAYEIAVKNGFSGTEREWLDTLTAFNIAKENGYTGTAQEWTDALLDKTTQQIFAFSAGLENEYTPKIDNVLTTENKAYYVREGKYLHVRGLLTFSSNLTGQFRLYLPDNLYTDGLIQTITDKEKYNVIGSASTIPAASNYTFSVLSENNSNWVTFRRADNWNFTAAAYSGTTFSYQFKVPIKGWVGSKFGQEVWDGTSGKSAYEIAIKNGFMGTEQEWLDTLDGYGIAKSSGFTGTKEEWIDIISEKAKSTIYNYTAGIPHEYTPTIKNVNYTENKAIYIREGKSIYIRGYITFSTAFTGELQISLPDDLTFDIFKSQNANSNLIDNNVIGSAIIDPQIANYIIRVCSKNESTYFTFNRGSDNWRFNNSSLISSTLMYELKAPITQWAGSALGDQVWDGTIGLSAYELAIKNGFMGTEQEWLDTLTSYGLAKEQGFAGTEQEWISKLTQNVENTLYSYSGSTPIQYTPIWENVNTLYTNAQYWREGKFLCVQGYAKFNSNTTAAIKFYIPNKDNLLISGLIYETETSNCPCLVGNAQYYIGNDKYIYYINAENEKNYVTFRKISNDFNDSLGSTTINLTGVGFTFFFKVPIKTWKGTQILDQIWDGTVGLSAYELAVKNGFAGTEQEWLDTLDAYETAKKRNIIPSTATVEDWYKELSLYGLAVKYDSFTGTIHEYLALFRTSVLPVGGDQGQFLIKQSGNKDDAQWQSVQFPAVTYQHIQDIASIKWEILHNLNTTEYNYIVKDIDEELVLCDINLEESTPNKLVVEFRDAQAGTCTIFAKTNEYVPVQTRNVMIDQYSEKSINHGNIKNNINIYINDAPIQKFTLTGNTNLKLFNWAENGRSSSVTLMFFSTGQYVLKFIDTIKWSAGTNPGFNMTSTTNWRVTFMSDDGGKTIYGFINGFNFS